MEKSALGNRMKRYEESYKDKLTPRMPVIIRCDGRAFHTLTRSFDKPFDEAFLGSMRIAMANTSKQMDGFKLAYHQSDEVSFLITDFDTLDTQGWFGYEVNKLVSISAALMTINFYKALKFEYGKSINNLSPVFDARAFNVPVDDVENYFLWRAKDWNRNSLQMYAQSIFSHKQLHKKNREDIHNMLYDAGKNWTTDLTSSQRNGTFYYGNYLFHGFKDDVLPTYDAISNLFQMVW